LAFIFDGKLFPARRQSFPKEARGGFCGVNLAIISGTRHRFILYENGKSGLRFRGRIHRARIETSDIMNLDE